MDQGRPGGEHQRQIGRIAAGGELVVSGPAVCYGDREANLAMMEKLLPQA